MLKERTAQHRMSGMDRQRQLLDAALSVFSRKGFKGATTREIAAAAGVTEAVIFQHFPTKEALYSAVLDLNLGASDGLDDMEEEVRGYMDSHDDEGIFRTIILHILNSYRHNAAFQRVVLFAALEGHEQGLARLQRLFQPYYQRFEDYVRQRQAEGAMTDCDPLTIWIVMGGMAHQYGLITRIMHAPIPDTADEVIAGQLTRILLDGIGRRDDAKQCKA